MNDIVIHSAKKRRWWVVDFLVPALEATGVPLNKIHCYEDTNCLGNLQAWLACADYLKQLDLKGDVWHLQDDVYPVHNFAEQAEFCESLKGTAHDGIVCGFYPRNQLAIKAGKYGHIDHFGTALNSECLLWSFQCIQIPTNIYIESVDWIRDVALKKFPKSKHCGSIKNLYNMNKGDDSLFFTFIDNSKYKNDRHWRCENCLVEHVDTFIGGSLLGHMIDQAGKFEDYETVIRKNYRKWMKVAEDMNNIGKK